MHRWNVGDWVLGAVGLFFAFGLPPLIMICVRDYSSVAAIFFMGLALLHFGIFSLWEDSEYMKKKLEREYELFVFGHLLLVLVIFYGSVLLMCGLCWVQDGCRWIIIG